MAQHPVFISYARKTSASHAQALHRELGGDSGLAFLDTSDIEALRKFPAEVSVLVQFQRTYPPAPIDSLRFDGRGDGVGL